MRASLLVFCAMALTTVLATNYPYKNVDVMMDHMAKGVMATPEPQLDQEPETCFTTQELIEFVKNIRRGEIRLNRFFGSYECVGERLFTTQPRRVFFRHYRFVRCFDSSFIINTVVSCAKEVQRISENAED